MKVFHASKGHLVPSYYGLAYALFVDTNTFPTFVMLFLSLHFEYRRLLSPFYGYHKNRLEFVGYGKYIISID